MNEALKKQIIAALETLEWSYSHDLEWAYKDPYIEGGLRDETVQDLEREILYLNELKKEIERAEGVG